VFRSLRLGVLLFLAANGSSAQPSQPVFDVASVKPAPPIGGRSGLSIGIWGGPGSADPGRLTARFASLGSLILRAYGIKPYKLVGPPWLDTQLFHIDAKVPEGSTTEQVSLMLRNLLADRFGLRLHKDYKEMVTYELIVANGGPKLAESRQADAAKDGDESGRSPLPHGPPKLDKDGFPVLPDGKGYLSATMNGRVSERYSRLSIGEFAAQIERQMGRPVIDSTGLRAKYDFTLHYAMQATNDGHGGAVVGESEPRAVSDPGIGPTFISALQSQLGLKLVSKKAKVEILVIDHAEKIPSAN